MHALLLPILLIVSLSAPVDATAAERAGTVAVHASASSRSSSSANYDLQRFRGLVFVSPTNCTMQTSKEDHGVRHTMVIEANGKASCISSSIVIEEEEMPRNYSTNEIDAYFFRLMNSNDATILGEWALSSFLPLSMTGANMLGLPARRYTYSGTLKGNAVRGESVYVAKGKSIFSVTTYAAPENFESQRAFFDVIVHSVINAPFEYMDATTVPPQIFPQSSRSSSSAIQWEKYILKPQRNNNEYSMVGIDIATNDGKTIIVFVVPHLSAYRAGLRPHDELLSVGTHQTSGATREEIDSWLMGPSKTKVTLRVRQGKTERTVTVQRDAKFERVPEFSISQKGGIVIVTSRMLGRWTVQHFRAEMERLNVPALRGIVLDLRQNGGGLADSMSIIPSAFVKKDTLVAQCNGSLNEKWITKEYPVIPSNIPLVILVDSATSSSAEIIARSLQLSRWATVIGEHTFGRAILQELVTYNDGTQEMKTLCRLKPAGNHVLKDIYNDVSVTPDIVILPSRSGRDTVLERALKELRKK